MQGEGEEDMLTKKDINDFIAAASTLDNLDWKDPYNGNMEMLSFAFGFTYVILRVRKFNLKAGERSVWSKSVYAKINRTEKKWDQLSRLFLNSFKEASHNIDYDEKKILHLANYVLSNIPRMGELTKEEQEALELGLAYYEESKI